MKVVKVVQDSRIQLALDINYSMDDLKQWKILIKNALMLSHGKKACVITISPQTYSVGSILENCQKLKREKRDYLVNWDMTLSEDVLHLIAESEDFDRGLLLIVFSGNRSDIFDTIDAIDSVGSIDFDKLTLTILVLEDDGKVFTWSYPTIETRSAFASLYPNDN